MAEDESYEKFEVTQDDWEDAFNPLKPKKKKFTKEYATYGMWAEEEDDGENLNEKSRSKQSKKSYLDPINFVSNEKSTKSSNESEIPKSKKSSLKVKEYDPFINTKKDVTKLGNWEKHTSGFGMKMLMKMGYKPGEGLGKDGSGIVEPIQATVRKGRGALGSYGSEQPNTSTKQVEVESSDNQRITQKTTDQSSTGPSLGQWRRKEKSAKVNYVYLYDEDIIKSSIENASLSGSNDVKIVDMTGPQTRVLTSYQQISSFGPSSSLGIQKEFHNFDVPELRQSLILALSETERSIASLDKKSKYNEDMKINLMHEKDRLKDECDSNLTELTTMREYIGALRKLITDRDSNKNKPIENYSEIENFFLLFKSQHLDLYESFSVADVAGSMLKEAIKNMLNVWNVLDSPSEHSLRFQRLQSLFDFHQNDSSRNLSRRNITTLNIYEQLIWSCWYPVVYRTINDRWNPHDPHILLDALDEWKSYIPQWIFDNLLHHGVMTILNNHVDEWDPLSDTIPIHTWIVPWISLLENKLHQLYLTIQTKFSNCLKLWHPSDSSALSILEPWVEIFPETQMHNLLSRCVVPKLVECMNSEFSINPRNQSLESFNWIMSWQNLISHQSMVNILIRGFFPKWIQALHTWLSHEPDYEQVSNWYLGWKSQFSKNLLDDPQIKEVFNKALRMMNRSVNNEFIDEPEPITNSRNKSTNAPPAQQKHVPDSIATTQNVAPSSFKDAVAKIAADKGMLFTMIPSRTKEGKPLYRFGDYVIYFERGVIFRQLNPTTWVPLSLQQLM